LAQSRYKPLLPSWAVECLLMLTIPWGLYRLVDYFFSAGFLPLPFVFDTSDTFMDWFNPAYYARNGLAYTEYVSVYAPLSFVLLEILGEPACYNSALYPKQARECDVVGIAAILIIFALCAILAAVAFYKRDRKTFFYRSVAFGLGLPMLYALERGNLIMIAFIFFIMLYGDLVRGRIAQAITAGLMINMKSYLLFPVLSMAVKRDWRLLELAGIATIGIYLVTMTIYGSGTPWELMNNLNVWFSAMSGIVWDQISYSTTYQPFLQFDTNFYPIRAFISDRTIEYITIFINTEVFASRVIALVCVGFAWLYPKAISKERLALFLLLQSFVSTNPGGYGFSLILFLIFLERWTNPLVGTAIVMAYILSIPTDFVLVTALQVERTSWLSQRIVSTVYGLSVGALLRPMAVVIILWSLALDTLITVHKLIRRERPLLQVSPSASQVSVA